MSQYVQPQEKVQKSRIFVCVRLRPLVSVDLGTGLSDPKLCVLFQRDGQTIQISKDKFSEKLFYPDRLFDAPSTQLEVYRQSFRYLIKDVLLGYNGTGLCYGQSGSGKTHTMFGTAQSKTPIQGLAHLAVSDIFSRVAARESERLYTTVSLSFYQIYIEQAYDLLRDLGDLKVPVALPIREDPKAGAFLENLSVIDCPDESTTLELIAAGLSNRKIRSTKYNFRSSRSHAILQIYLDFEEDTASSRTSGGGGPESVYSSAAGGSTASSAKDSKHLLSLRKRTLTFVDLAGSERVQSYGEKLSKTQLKEAVQINKSISCLGNCIQALATYSSDQWRHSAQMAQAKNPNQPPPPPPHVPYRDCKLTRLLAAPLGGNAKTVIIANIGPCLINYEETLSTLKFASRAMMIRKTVDNDHDNARQALHESKMKQAALDGPTISNAMTGSLNLSAAERRALAAGKMSENVYQPPLAPTTGTIAAAAGTPRGRTRSSSSSTGINMRGAAGGNSRQRGNSSSSSRGNALHEWDLGDEDGSNQYTADDNNSYQSFNNNNNNEDVYDVGFNVHDANEGLFDDTLDGHVPVDAPLGVLSSSRSYLFRKAQVAPPSTIVGMDNSGIGGAAGLGGGGGGYDEFGQSVNGDNMMRSVYSNQQQQQQPTIGRSALGSLLFGGPAAAVAATAPAKGATSATSSHYFAGTGAFASGGDGGANNTSAAAAAATARVVEGGGANLGNGASTGNSVDAYPPQQQQQQSSLLDEVKAGQKTFNLGSFLKACQDQPHLSSVTNRGGGAATAAAIVDPADFFIPVAVPPPPPPREYLATTNDYALQHNLQHYSDDNHNNSSTMNANNNYNGDDDDDAPRSAFSVAPASVPVMTTYSPAVTYPLPASAMKPKSTSSSSSSSDSSYSPFRPGHSSMGLIHNDDDDEERYDQQFVGHSNPYSSSSRNSLDNSTRNTAAAAAVPAATAVSTSISGVTHSLSTSLQRRIAGNSEGTARGRYNKHNQHNHHHHHHNSNSNSNIRNHTSTPPTPPLAANAHASATSTNTAAAAAYNNNNAGSSNAGNVDDKRMSLDHLASSLRGHEFDFDDDDLPRALPHSSPVELRLMDTPSPGPVNSPPPAPTPQALSASPKPIIRHPSPSPSPASPLGRWNSAKSGINLTTFHMQDAKMQQMKEKAILEAADAGGSGESKSSSAGAHNANNNTALSELASSTGSNAGRMYNDRRKEPVPPVFKGVKMNRAMKNMKAVLAYSQQKAAEKHQKEKQELEEFANNNGFLGISGASFGTEKADLHKKRLEMLKNIRETSKEKLAPTLAAQDYARTRQQRLQEQRRRQQQRRQSRRGSRSKNRRGSISRKTYFTRPDEFDLTDPMKAAETNHTRVWGQNDRSKSPIKYVPSIQLRKKKGGGAVDGGAGAATAEQKLTEYKKRKRRASQFAAMIEEERRLAREQLKKGWNQPMSNNNCSRSPASSSNTSSRNPSPSRSSRRMSAAEMYLPEHEASSKKGAGALWNSTVHAHSGGRRRSVSPNSPAAMAAALAASGRRQSITALPSSSSSSSHRQQALSSSSSGGKEPPAALEDDIDFSPFRQRLLSPIKGRFGGEGGTADNYDPNEGVVANTNKSPFSGGRSPSSSVKFASSSSVSPSQRTPLKLPPRSSSPNINIPPAVILMASFPPTSTTVAAADENNVMPDSPSSSRGRNAGQDRPPTSPKVVLGTGARAPTATYPRATTAAAAVSNLSSHNTSFNSFTSTSSAKTYSSSDLGSDAFEDIHPYQSSLDLLTSKHHHMAKMESAHIWPKMKGIAESNSNSNSNSNNTSPVPNFSAPTSTPIISASISAHAENSSSSSSNPYAGVKTANQIEKERRAAAAAAASAATGNSNINIIQAAAAAKSPKQLFTERREEVRQKALEQTFKALGIEETAPLMHGFNPSSSTNSSQKKSAPGGATTPPTTDNTTNTTNNSNNSNMNHDDRAAASVSPAARLFRRVSVEQDPAVSSGSESEGRDLQNNNNNNNNTYAATIDDTTTSAISATSGGGDSGSNSKPKRERKRRVSFHDSIPPPSPRPGSPSNNSIRGANSPSSPHTGAVSLSSTATPSATAPKYGNKYSIDTAARGTSPPDKYKQHLSTTPSSSRIISTQLRPEAAAAPAPPVATVPLPAAATTTTTTTNALPKRSVVNAHTASSAAKYNVRALSPVGGAAASSAAASGPYSSHATTAHGTTNSLANFPPPPPPTASAALLSSSPADDSDIRRMPIKESKEYYSSFSDHPSNDIPSPAAVSGPYSSHAATASAAAAAASSSSSSPFYKSVSAHSLVQQQGNLDDLVDSYIDTADMHINGTVSSTPNKSSEASNSARSSKTSSPAAGTDTLEKINSRLNWGVKSFSETNIKAKEKLGQLSELRHSKLVSLVYQLQNQVNSHEEELKEKERTVHDAQKQVSDLKKYILTAL